jgi:hypothetical protein
MDTTLTNCEIHGRDMNVVLEVEISANLASSTKPTENMRTMSEYNHNLRI